MSREILFLAHRLPFPPDRGDKIRSHHILRRLAAIAPVHVATFADCEADLAYQGDLARVARTHCLVRRDKPLWRAGIEALARDEPVSLTAFRDARLASYVAKTLAGGEVGTIYVFSGQMGQYVPADFPGRVLMDLVDVDSVKFDAYGQAGPWPRRWIDAREGRLLRKEEERLAHRADRTLFVSEAEADLFRSRLADPAGTTIAALRNGIDANYFDPARTVGSPAVLSGPGPHCVFTGQMDYAPNVAAALRLIARIMPALRRTHPAAQCHIVGRNPPPALLAHDGKDGCRIWGQVPDVRPYLAAADAVIVPLEIARGVQNKVLEAMAMARPVLLTPEAATGIGGQDGVHYAVARDDAALVAQACRLIDDPQAGIAMGQAARRFVIDNLGWETVLAPLAEMVREAPGSQKRRNAA
jgi:sugar transferase (PEP-CTERM/EpsH1 system associated)